MPNNKNNTGNRSSTDRLIKDHAPSPQYRIPTPQPTKAPTSSLNTSNTGDKK